MGNSDCHWQEYTCSNNCHLLPSRHGIESPFCHWGIPVMVSKMRFVSTDLCWYPVCARCWGYREEISSLSLIANTDWLELFSFYNCGKKMWLKFKEIAINFASERTENNGCLPQIYSSLLITPVSLNYFFFFHPHELLNHLKYPFLHLVNK